MTKCDWGLQLMQGVLICVMAPGAAGLLRWLKAGLQGRYRRLTAIWQPYRDLWKLFVKAAVRPETTSWVFAIAPPTLFIAYGWLAFLVPVFCEKALLSVDLFVVVYVLGLAHFVLALAGLDAGSPFGALGGYRTMFFHFITEVGFILVAAALTFQSNKPGLWASSDLGVLFSRHSASSWTMYLGNFSLVLLMGSLAILALFENGRLPMNNAHTHLELTMGSEAVFLEYGGRDLAILHWAEMIKMTFFIALLIQLFLPFPLTAVLVDEGTLRHALTIIDLGLKFFVVIAALVMWELHRPKLRLRSVIRPGLIAYALGLIAIVLLALTGGGAP